MLRQLMVPGGVLGGAAISFLYSVTYVGSLCAIDRASWRP